MKLLEGLSLKTSVHSLEDAIITLSGPALAISGIIAGVDLLTGGNMLRQVYWLSLAWAICLLLTLDFQVLSLGARSHQIYLSDKSAWRKGIEVALVVIIAAAISYVSIQMQSIIARSNSAGLDIGTATVQLGINPIWLIWERSALVLVLIFLSGWFRQEQVKHPVPSVPQPETPVGISDETVQIILAKLAKLDDLEQQIAQQKVTLLSENNKPLALPVPSVSTSLNIVPMRIKATQPIYNVLDKVDGLPSAIPFVPLGSDGGTEDDERAIQAHIAEVLVETPEIKVRELAAIVGHPQTTVYRHMVIVKKQMEQNISDGTKNEKESNP